MDHYLLLCVPPPYEFPIHCPPKTTMMFEGDDLGIDVEADNFQATMEQVGEGKWADE